MNEYECGSCGCYPCVCFKEKEIKKITEEQEVIEIAWRIFATLPKWKLRLIRWFWPEILDVATAMLKYYWSEDVTQD